MKLKDYFCCAMSIPQRKLASKAVDRTGRKIRFFLQRQKDFRTSTYTQRISSSPEEIYCYLQALPIDLLHSQADIIFTLSRLFLAHQFNLLGSGWVRLKHGVSCNGLEGYRYEMGPSVYVDSEGCWLKNRINQSNLSESRRIWSLVDHDYIPIDWHLDFKSGYRWGEDVWYLDILYGHKRGADIKVPWELARMQHLPLLAWAFALSKDGQEDFAPPSVYSREFRNQVLDFVATNPPRFGVNWRSPMDVAIRVTNWLVAYDLFRAYGVEFDNEFKKEFFRSLREHGQHILRNLEWHEDLRGNHYLSNIVGLLFVASYLPRTSETDAWLALAVQELGNEVRLQFTADGANFEGSTSYHRLSAEMVIYATALILGLPEEKREAMRHYDDHLHKGLPKLNPAPICFYPLPGEDIYTPFSGWYFERLEKMAEFTVDVTKPNANVVQIGDNDSGRFLKLQPIFRQSTVGEAKSRSINFDDHRGFPENGIYWDEEYLDHRHLVAAINGLFQRCDFGKFAGEERFESDIIRNLANRLHLPSYKQARESIRAKEVSVEIARGSVRSDKIDSLNERIPEDISPKRSEQYGRLGLRVYPNFGLYVYRLENVYLAIHCGSTGQHGDGGHAHNDQLSYELGIKGQDFVVDGGSFLYTPIPEVRNAFRSTRAHNTLSIPGFEQNRWEDGLRGLFSMKSDVQHHIINYNGKSFEGKYFSRGIEHARSFKFGTSEIIIEDTTQRDLLGELNLNFAPGVEIIQINRDGVDEFTTEIKISNVHPRIILNGFSRVEVTEGFFSQGYGKRLKNQLLKCHRSRSVTKAIIEIGIG